MPKGKIILVVIVLTASFNLWLVSAAHRNAVTQTPEHQSSIEQLYNVTVLEDGREVEGIVMELKSKTGIAGVSFYCDRDSFAKRRESQTDDCGSFIGTAKRVIILLER